MTDKQRNIVNALLKLFKIEGVSADVALTESQKIIFAKLVFRKSKRVQIMCSTQYGKSLTIALAALVISCIQKEVVSIVAPKKEQARIIMRYYIEHLGDNPVFAVLLEKNSKLDRLRMEESQERIILKHGGGIFTLSVEAGNSTKGLTAAMGMGSRIVISDESSLIPDIVESTIFRMIAGKGEDAFYCKIGNPFFRNHFYYSSVSDKYDVVNIDYITGLKEGRYTQSFIEEARTKPNFSILFENKFPPADAMDQDGFVPLVPEGIVKQRLALPETQLFGTLKLSIDVAGEGSNESVITLVAKNAAKVLFKAHTPDIMALVPIIVGFVTQYKIESRNIVIDKNGVGLGLYNRLREIKETKDIVGFNGGEAAISPDFHNKRAECYYKLKVWLMSEGYLIGDHRQWRNIEDIRTKTTSSGKMIIKSKPDMLKDGIPSPDVPDSLSMSFAIQDNVAFTVRKDTPHQSLGEYGG